MLVYLAGAKAGKDENGRKTLALALTRLYQDVHKLWDIIRKGLKNRVILESYAGHALRYWEDETPAETVMKDDVSGLAVDLQCFARYTLSLCPSSCATERSFSHQGRIHTKQRSRLKPEVVQKLLFCKWNTRVLQKMDRLQLDKIKDADKFKLGSINPYEEFMSKPSTISLFDNWESEELLKRILLREQRTREQIKRARGLLYGNLHSYLYAAGKKIELTKEGMSSRPTVSTSVRLSAHERSTTVGGEHSAIVRSPSTPDQPSTYHATNAQELAVLLSASKDAARRPTRVAQTDLARAREQNIETNTPAIPQALRDEDNITMSVAAARAMMHNQDKTAKMILKPVDPSVFDSSDDRRFDQPQSSLSEARSGPPVQAKTSEDIDNYPYARSRCLLNSKARGRGRGRPNMAYVPVHEISKFVRDVDAKGDDDVDDSWDDEDNLH